MPITVRQINEIPKLSLSRPVARPVREKWLRAESIWFALHSPTDRERLTIYNHTVELIFVERLTADFTQYTTE